MKIEKIDINLLKIAKYNPRKDLQPEDVEYQKIRRSIEEFGYVDPLIVNKDMTVIGGNQRLKVLKELDYKKVDCVLVDLDKTKEKALNIALNKIEGEWDLPKLKDLLLELDTGEIDMDITGFDYTDLEKLMTQFYVDDIEEARKTLRERFIIPPFSVFDTRQGYWQDRKKAWKNLGIKSETGRELDMAYHGQDELNKFKGYHKNTDNYQGAHNTGTSIFDPVLCEICYKWFCVEGGNIIDPFAGGSVRGIVANYLGYKYTGIDLSKRQIEDNIEQANIVLKDKIKPSWIIGNSLNMDKLVKDKVDFIFSCPPYFDLEKYSDDPKDLSNLEWEDFKNQYKEIISKTVNLLKDDRFACFVVSEIRDKKGIFRNFVDYTKYCFLDAGMEFYNDIVLINVAGSLPIRVNRYFSAGRKVGKMHQNVLVFYKGDISKIKENYKNINIEDLKRYEKAELIENLN